MVDPTIVNAVGGGDIGQKLHLSEINKKISGEEVRYDPEHWPGVYIRLKEESPAIFLFRTGKYNIAGADSVNELIKAHKRILSRLQNLDYTYQDTDFEVRNLVFIDEFSRELDLEPLSMELGLENTEYNSEQFPGLVHSPAEFRGTFIIFRSGKIIYTGSNDAGEAKRAFESLFGLLHSLFTSNNQEPPQSI